jgi:hypothetical protein
MLVLVPLLAAAVLVLSAVLLVALGLIRNRLAWSDPPGFRERLSIYLNQHVAETADDPILPELKSRISKTAPSVLYETALNAVTDLGWEIASQDSTNHEIHAVVTTSLWKFKDDVTIRLEEAPGGGTRLYVKSKSRVGKGDLGTNLRHVLDLCERVWQTMGKVA